MTFPHSFNPIDDRSYPHILLRHSFPSSLHPSYLQPSTHLCSPTCPNQESDKPCIPWHQTVCSPTFHSYPPCLSLPCFPFLGFHWLLDLNSIPTNLLLNLYLSLDSTPGLTVIKSRARARSLYDVTANFPHPIRSHGASNRRPPTPYSLFPRRAISPSTYQSRSPHRFHATSSTSHLTTSSDNNFININNEYGTASDQSDPIQSNPIHCYVSSSLTNKANSLSLDVLYMKKGPSPQSHDPTHRHRLHFPPYLRFSARRNMTIAVHIRPHLR